MTLIRHIPAHPQTSDVKFGANKPIRFNLREWLFGPKTSLADEFQKTSLSTEPGGLGVGPSPEQAVVAPPPLPLAGPLESHHSVNEALGAFTGKVMASLSARATTENTVFMPSNTFLLASGLTLGAQGKTREELLQALGLSQDITSQQLNQEIIGLRNDLAALGSKDTIFNTGFSVWTPAGDSAEQVFTPHYQQFMKEQQAEVGTFTPGNASPINNWANTLTNGKIPEILTDAEVAGASLVLGSASYFKSPFRYKFRYLEDKGTFQGVKGSQEVRMMNASQKYRYLDGNQFQAFTLPFEGSDKNNLNITMILPKENAKLDEVYRSLSQGDQLQSTLASLGAQAETKLDLTMPDFETNTSLDTKEVLEKMGVHAPFEGEKDGFAGMLQDAKGASVSKMKQKAFLKIDKDGGEGGAVDVAVVTRGGPVDLPVEIVVDRPFMYVVHDNKRPLMVGTVNHF